MSAVSLRKQCVYTAKRLKRSKDPYIRGELFYILPRLRSAGKAFSRRGGAAFADRLSAHLQLTGYRADGQLLRSFLTGAETDDHEIRNIRYYLIFVYCRLILSGKQVSPQLREAEKLDFDAIISDCSPLESKLSQYEDYYESDPATKAEYRRRLYMLARKKRTAPAELLRGIQTHRFTDTLMTRKSLALPFIIMLFSVFILLFCISAAVMRGAFALFAAVPVFCLSLYICSMICGRIVPVYVCPRVNEDVPLPRCLIVITAKLDRDTAELAGRLRSMYYTEGKKKNVYFGILADLPDSRKKYDRDDDALIGPVQNEINKLNETFGGGFYLFYRQRRYSFTEDRFIAPERKRGAVCELVKLLFTGNSSLTVFGDPSGLTDIPYIITLDSDTLLYPGSAASLLRCAVHPANRAVTDPQRRVVVKGHGIFQPRIGVVSVSGDDTPFSSVFARDRGTDAYHAADFDPGSAILGRGSFCGKGLIDVAAFYTCCCDVFEDGVILSHDALEGCRCACAAVTDTVMYESVPKNALSYFKRLDRWVRGDIQTLHFTGKYLKNNKEKRKNGLRLTDRVILYNSVVCQSWPVFAVLCTVCGALTGALPAASAVGTCCLWFPCAVSFFGSLRDRGRRLMEASYFLFRMSFLFYEAQTVFFASVRALYRLSVRKRTLQWTTASAADAVRHAPSAYALAFLPSVLFGASSVFFSHASTVFSGVLLMISPILAYRSSLSAPPAEKKPSDREFLTGTVAEHMRYFSDLVNAEHSYLPPDNYQQFCGAGAAPRTSPTNIGLYLLSVISAVDVGVSKPDGLYDTLAPTLGTLCRIPKKNGLLYNWYDTRTCAPLGGFVSTVDCGNYLACLITLRRSLFEYSGYDGRLNELIGITEKLISECDLSRLYDNKTDLFFIGSGGKSEYDLYCSEMLTTDVLSVALGFAPPSHIGALSRPVIRSRGRVGIASSGGTAFEYFMPALFLPAFAGTAGRFARDFAAFAQESESARFCGKRIFGMSESCYFAFDADTVYQYKAHGAKSLALHGDGRERVFSPYSLFLMLGYSENALPTLRHLKENGLCGRYGFYEAVDLTRDRVGDGYAVIKCSMAHHIGMSVVAAANALCGDVFVRRFCADPRVAAVLPVLYEKAPRGRGIRTAAKTRESARVLPEQTGTEPDNALITNTFCTAVSDRYGTGLYCGGACICSEKAEGMRGLSVFADDGTDLIRLPVGFSSERVVYRSGGYEAALTVCPDLPVFRIDVRGGKRCSLAFEPIMRELFAHERHTAFSSLFITSGYENGAVFFTRRGRSSSVLCVAAYGKGGRIPGKVRVNGEQIHGMTVKQLAETQPPAPPRGEEACIYPRLFFTAECGRVSFFIAFAKTLEQADAALCAAARKREREPVGLPPADADMMCRVLGCMMRPAPKTASSFGRDPVDRTLYRHGISGERPIILLDATGAGGIHCARPLIPRIASVTVRLLIAGIAADTVILYDGEKGYADPGRAELDRAVGSCGLTALVGRCVFIVPDDKSTGKILNDICVFRLSAADGTGSFPTGYPGKEKFEGSQKKLLRPALYGRTAVVPVGVSFAPMSYIYANACFGALVYDRGGGYCWYGNSRMYALTAHDTSPGSTGDELIFERNGRKFELFSYADECRFSPCSAKWSGSVCGAPYTVTLCVDDRAPFKTLKLSLPLDGTLTYRTVPVLGETRINGTLRFARQKDAAFVSRAYGEGMPSFFVRCENSVAEYDGMTLTVKKAHSASSLFIIGAAYSRAVTEYAASSFCSSAKRYMKKLDQYLSPFTLRGAGDGIDAMYNLFSRYQALYCRQYARCGPYQTGGAYGFRDQLQDCLCTVYGAEKEAKAHIIRCAAHQYEEGDVMHWFHPLTGYGVRTHCSDDMLWLPYAVSEYIRITGDRAILDANIRYITSPPLCGERDRYEKAVISDRRGTLLEHCEKAVLRIRTGEHGLCLMGGGDWNDGMDEAGAGGRGESVWLTLFAAGVLRRMADMCGESSYRVKASELISAVESHGWDGRQYIRGYLDSGEPFGRSGDDMCETDILPQAFAAFLGLDKDRVTSALDTAYDRLYDEKHGIFKLFTPPFGERRGIGYITSYPAGIRENGGQYTHAAVWGAMGFFTAGMKHRGYEILKALCPLRHMRDEGSFMSYGREPYVFAGDVYGAKGLEGHGGWSWYTGAAGWYFNAVLGYLLGYREHDGGFEIKPAFSAQFHRFTLTVRRKGTEYVITAENVKKRALLDGAVTDAAFFLFDGGAHTLDIGAD